MFYKSTTYDKVQDSRSFSAMFCLYIIAFVFFLVFFGGMLFIATDSAIFSKQINDALLDIDNAKLVLPLLQLLSEKAEANGYAPLGPDGLIPLEFLPTINVSNLLNGGCWDAATNNPSLSDGVGINGLHFVVCVPGTTSIDGNSEWRSFDQLIFNGGLGVWQRIDSSRNEINNAAIAGGNEAAIMSDTEGPLFEARTMTVSGPNMSITNDGNETIAVDLIAETANPQSITSVGDGESILGTITPTVWEAKTLTASGAAVLTETPQGIVLSSNQSSINVDVGVTWIDAAVIVGSSTVPRIQFSYNKIGDVLRITNFRGYLATPNSGGFFLVQIDLTTATDPFIASQIVPMMGDVSGQLTTTEGPANGFAGSGNCRHTGMSTVINCALMLDTTVGLPEDFLIAINIFTRTF